MARTLDTRSILEMCDRQKEFFSASFRDNARRVYVLNIISANPEKHEVVVQQPQGRTSPLDPQKSWLVTFTNDRGAYQTQVVSMVTEEGLIHVQVQPKTVFLARRKSIRLPTGSRNPVTIVFYSNGTSFKGIVVDFSLEGLGLEIDGLPGLDVGQVLSDGIFNIRGTEVRFQSAQIVQKAWHSSKMRLGIEFQKLTGSQEEAIRLAFYQGISSHSTISTVLDG